MRASTLQPKSLTLRIKLTSTEDKTMLKIKDNIDLKELEKFGFKYDKCNSMYYKSFEYKKFCQLSAKYDARWETFIEEVKIDVPSRRIHSTRCYQVFMDYDTLYDLIQDGLVEKVKVQDE